MSNSTDAVKGMSDLDIQLPSLEEGSLVKGKVIEVKEGQVIVDLNYKTEGIINLSEFVSEISGEKQEVKPGDLIEAVVVKKEDEEGRIILSKKRADFRRAWEQVRTAYYEGSAIEAPAVQVVKGGLVLDGGVRLFLPASQVDLKKPIDLNAYLGKKIKVKIISLDERKKTAVVSRRAFLEETGYSLKKDVLARLKVGQVLKGKVKSLVDYGAFVEVQGVTGLVHLSEIAWRRVTDPSQFLEVGQEVEAKVVQIDLEKERLSLSIKRLQTNPWMELAAKYRAGQRVKAKVVRFAPFGVFLELAGFEGLLHQNEMREDLAVLQKNYSPGDEIEVGILSIDTFHQRISFTQFISAEEPGKDKKLPATSKEVGKVKQPSEFETEVADGKEETKKTKEKEEKITTELKVEPLEKEEQPLKEYKEAVEKTSLKAEKVKPISTGGLNIENEVEDKTEEIKEETEESLAEEALSPLAPETQAVEPEEIAKDVQAEVGKEKEEKKDESLVEELLSHASTLEDILELMKKTHGSKKKDL